MVKLLGKGERHHFSRIFYKTFVALTIVINFYRIIMRTATFQINKIILIFFLFIIFPVYAACSELDNKVAVETPNASNKKIEVEELGKMNSSRSFVNSFKANGGYLDVGLRTGYMSGYNSFDLNHHVSELKYPFDIYLGGVTVSLGHKRTSLNLELSGSLFNDPNRGWNMEDKDWDDDGDLESYTKSKSSMNAVIGDVNLRYNFLDYTLQKNETDEDSSKLKFELGGLLGYRYQRYRYRMHGAYQIVEGAGTGDVGEDVLVLVYQVTYHLPYIGLSAKIGNDRLGFSLSGKYGFSASADDIDQHVGGATTRANYKKNPNVFMADVSAYWKFSKNWQVNTGVDIALIRIDGKLHEENYDPNWNLDQNIDTRQFIYWVGFGYRF